MSSFCEKNVFVCTSCGARPQRSLKGRPPVVPGYDPRTIGRTETAGLGARGQVCSETSSHQIEKTSAFPASPGNPITPTIGYAPEVDETASISPYQHHHSPHLTTKHATSASSHTHSWCPCSPALTVTAPISAKSTGRSQLVWMSTLAMPEPPTIANCSRYNSIAA